MDKISKEAFLQKTVERAARKQFSVLIVEDQKFSRQILKSFLISNFTVHTAENGKQALLKYMENVPNILFLDLELPDLSGFEICELITQLDSESYIIIVSGNSAPADVQRAIKKGAKTFITKPFTKVKIVASVEQFFKLHGVKPPNDFYN